MKIFSFIRKVIKNAQFLAKKCKYLQIKSTKLTAKPLKTSTQNKIIAKLFRNYFHSKSSNQFSSTSIKRKWFYEFLRKSNKNSINQIKFKLLIKFRLNLVKILLKFDFYFKKSKVNSVQNHAPALERSKHQRLVPSPE